MLTTAGLPRDRGEKIHEWAGGADYAQRHELEPTTKESGTEANLSQVTDEKSNIVHEEAGASNQESNSAALPNQDEPPLVEEQEPETPDTTSITALSVSVLFDERCYVSDLG